MFFLDLYILVIYHFLKIILYSPAYNMLNK